MLLWNSKLKIVIMISSTSQFSVISALYRKEYNITVNINSNNFTVYFKSDNIVKLSPWFCGWIESTFYVHLLFILRHFFAREGTYYRGKWCAHYCELWRAEHVLQRTMIGILLYYNVCQSPIIYLRSAVSLQDSAHRPITTNVPPYSDLWLTGRLPTISLQICTLPTAYLQKMIINQLWL